MTLNISNKSSYIIFIISINIVSVVCNYRPILDKKGQEKLHLLYVNYTNENNLPHLVKLNIEQFYDSYYSPQFVFPRYHDESNELRENKIKKYCEEHYLTQTKFNKLYKIVLLGRLVLKFRSCLQSGTNPFEMTRLCCQNNASSKDTFSSCLDRLENTQKTHIGKCFDEFIIPFTKIFGEDNDLKYSYYDDDFDRDSDSESSDDEDEDEDDSEKSGTKSSAKKDENDDSGHGSDSEKSGTKSSATKDENDDSGHGSDSEKSGTKSSATNGAHENSGDDSDSEKSLVEIGNDTIKLFNAATNLTAQLYTFKDDNISVYTTFFREIKKTENVDKVYEVEDSDYNECYSLYMNADVKEDLPDDIFVGFESYEDFTKYTQMIVKFLKGIEGPLVNNAQLYKEFLEKPISFKDYNELRIPVPLPHENLYPLYSLRMRKLGYIPLNKTLWNEKSNKPSSSNSIKDKFKQGYLYIKNLYSRGNKKFSILR